MIVHFECEELRKLFIWERSGKIKSSVQALIIDYLDMLDAARSERDFAGHWAFQTLGGEYDSLCALHVEADMFITFRFDANDVRNVDLVHDRSLLKGPAE